MTASTLTVPTADRYAALLETAGNVARQLRSTAAGRDRANQAPRAQIGLLRENDLLQVQERPEYGGAGLSYAQAAQITQRAPGFSLYR
jgi:alkylation response protein AidB-like acyl-CoA dehydrogenase